jgi:hypothetical protein
MSLGAKRANAACHHASSNRIYSSSVNHSVSVDQRLRLETFFTAIATAVFWPTSMTGFLPHVTLIDQVGLQSCVGGYERVEIAEPASINSCSNQLLHKRSRPRVTAPSSTSKTQKTPDPKIWRPMITLYKETT